MILHIPHASTRIPPSHRDAFLLSDRALADEHLLMTDAFTDVLFRHPKATRVVFPLSRLLVDVERFREDADEAMSRFGMGVLYTKTAHGDPLRRALSAEERLDLLAHYDGHHAQLALAVRSELEERGSALIIDAHSFPNTPLPCNGNSRTPRPDFCIGTDAAHTPPCLSSFTEGFLAGLGCSVWMDEPYQGALVPRAFHRKDDRVLAIMIEVNRRLYMDEATGRKAPGFPRTQAILCALLEALLSGWRRQRFA